MKFLLPIAAFLGLAAADMDDARECLIEKCPSEYDTCMAVSTCEPTLLKCIDKCGAKLNLFCWGGCASYNTKDPVVKIATCALNNGCAEFLGAADVEPELPAFEELEKIIEEVLKLARE